MKVPQAVMLRWRVFFPCLLPLFPRTVFGVPSGTSVHCLLVPFTALGPGLTLLLLTLGKPCFLLPVSVSCLRVAGYPLQSLTHIHSLSSRFTLFLLCFPTGGSADLKPSTRGFKLRIQSSTQQLVLFLMDKR
jgi:hypothetical protein